MVNFTTVACRISSRLKWYKNYKNRLRLAKVIVKNKLPRFLWFTVYICTLLHFLEVQQGWSCAVLYRPLSLCRRNNHAVWSELALGSQTGCESMINALSPPHMYTILALRLTSHVFMAIVDSSPCKHEQTWTVAFSRVPLTNEYRYWMVRRRIWMFYWKFKFSNFV